MTVRLQLLGQFQAVVDGVAVPQSAWARRHAAALVKALALADGRRLHREQLAELLWPGVEIQAVAPRLHKAVYYARRALGASALKTGNEMLWLGDVAVDVAEFHALGERAIRDNSADAAAGALAMYAGPLLPEDVFETWTERPRDEARVLYVDLLRLIRKWDAVLQEEPSDEQAHLALIRARADQRDFRGALRQFQRMEQALQRELGVVPSNEAVRLRAKIETAVRGRLPTAAPQDRQPLIGRRGVGKLIWERLDRAAQGRGGTLLLSGPPGVGKTALLERAIELAEQRGFRTGRGTASAVEGPWPYAAVLEGFSDLCRKHPALLDGLDDALRTELERALSGRGMAWTGESSHQRLFVAAAELLRIAAAGHGLLLAVDDIHESDDASLRLLHYLSRCAVSESVLIVAAYRPSDDAAFVEISESLVSRAVGTRVPLQPLTEQETMQLLADGFPNLSTERARQIWMVSGGLPFAIVEAARGHATRGRAALSALPAPARTTLQRVALLGASFTADELLACAEVDENEA